MQLVNLGELVIAVVGVVLLDWWRRRRRARPDSVGPEYFTRQAVLRDRR
jgi:hypothetical protein